MSQSHRQDNRQHMITYIKRFITIYLYNMLLITRVQNLQFFVGSNKQPTTVNIKSCFWEYKAKVSI